MRIATAFLKSASPFQYGKPVPEKKQRDETHDAFEERTWIQRAHVNAEGNLFIPPMAFKNCLSEAAKYKSIQIPGKGKSTYTKHFEAGVMVVEPLVLPIQVGRLDTIDCSGDWTPPDGLVCLPLFVPADGRRGSGKRVWKKFPVLEKWEGVVNYIIMDEIIDNDTFEQHLIDSGQFIGVGAFRPRNNGSFGRFDVEKVKWS